jgi:ABC-2 type transport system permease protein
VRLAPVIRRGLRDQRRAPLTWGGSLGAMSALVALMWPSVEGSMLRLMDSYPE